MKWLFLIAGIGMVTGMGCKHKKTGPEENVQFFPVLSFLKSQVKDIDTSVYPLLKIVTVDSVSDTSYIKREEFSAYASDFLTIPDISDNKYKDDYTESRMYDETLGRAVFDYTPKDKETEIQREEVMITPDEQGDKVKAIIINRIISKGDSTVKKNMLWQVAKRFQIVTIVQKRNSPDKIKTTEIVWNDFHPAE